MSTVLMMYEIRDGKWRDGWNFPSMQRSDELHAKGSEIVLDCYLLRTLELFWVKTEGAVLYQKIN